MSRYLVQSRHDPADCLQTLDAALALGDDMLDRYEFGCAVGDHSNHVCFTSVEAPSEAGARSQLPGVIRTTAVLTEVGKFTPAQIRSYHT